MCGRGTGRMMSGDVGVKGPLREFTQFLEKGNVESSK